ncbi:MAG: GIY-YIG nuclease family protein [Calditrichaeota bacterium]|jgi:putative endonuclease|nr:GIY-YIG nuclease family protein [Calditrichota bacterium]MBT7787298.1 GIY-YIG nuclease family protein [Calditrichota bacterium]
MKQAFVYIMANERNGTIYIGVTSDLLKRVLQHKQNLFKGFTKKYLIHQLVYYEVSDSINSAIVREKQLKKWKRLWKLKLIESVNPEWEDLYERILL